MFLLGINFASYKHVRYALRDFIGIGAGKAEEICREAYIHPLCKMGELQEVHLERLKPIIQKILDDQRQKRLLNMKLKAKNVSKTT